MVLERSQQSWTNEGREPIAITGIGCRFPGGIENPEAFWRLLVEGGDAVGYIPDDRFDVKKYYDPAPATPGKTIARHGGFLRQVDAFDAAFFGLSPREAAAIDPQQRLLLELAWEALEDAGEVVDTLEGSSTGVFVGLWLADYESLLHQDPAAATFYSCLGSGHYAASGRISYTFGLQGPSLTVNTHCSSSLVAVHLACQSLWSGESSMALAGGANIILQPHVSIAYSQSQMLSPDGRSKFGDANADGYVRGEGAGIVVLKPLSQAIADGDRVYATIRGSAVNNDGRSGRSLGTPGIAGQEALLRQAYRHAGIEPHMVHYVEAHGSGTKVGDRAELAALGAVVCSGRPGHDICHVGSVKSNIGHAEAAAGIAGLIKVALMLQRRTIPPSLHIREKNPSVAWDALQLDIATKLTPWPDVETAVAGVTSLSIAGTNAHVVLVEAPAAVGAQPAPEEAQESSYLLPLSAQSHEALQALARAYQEMLEGTEALSLRDVCYTASSHRTHLRSRVALVADGRRRMAEQLALFLRGEKPGVYSGSSGRSGRPNKIAFAFSGFGSQWPGMGRDLLQREPVFRQTLEACEHAMRPYVDWSLLEQLSGPSSRSRLHELTVLEPTLVSFAIALAALWRRRGIEPDAVIGHSIGEVAAAVTAGALALEDAMRVICHQSRYMEQSRSAKTGMAIVNLPEDDVREIIHAYAGQLVIAGLNSPQSVTLSGDSRALEELMTQLQARNVFARRLDIDVAAHSPALESCLSELSTFLDGIEPRPATVPFYSATRNTVIEGAMDIPDRPDGAYWIENFREPVNFDGALRRLLTGDTYLFIEMSPHPILLPAIRQGLQHAGMTSLTLPSLQRHEAEQATLLTSLGSLYEIGASIDWTQLYAAQSVNRVRSLPLYPWQRQRYWYGEQNNETGEDDLRRTLALRERERARAADGGAQREQANLGEAFLAAKPGRQRQRLLEDHVRQQVAEVLKRPVSQITRDSSFQTTGLDSLTAVEFANRLQVTTGLSLAPTLVWSYPSVVSVARYLADKLTEAASPTGDEAIQFTGNGAGSSVSEVVEPFPDEANRDLLKQLEDATTADLELLLEAELSAIDDLLER